MVHICVLVFFADSKRDREGCYTRMTIMGSQHNDGLKQERRTFSALTMELHLSCINPSQHYCDAIMGTVASQITSLTIVYTTVYSDADQSKHQSSASLAFVRGIHRGPVNSPHKGPVTRKMFPFDDAFHWPYVTAIQRSPANKRLSRQSSYLSFNTPRRWCDAIVM